MKGGDLLSKEIVEPDWLVRDLLVKRTVNVLWAIAGMGKSFFALQLSLSVAAATKEAPGNFLGFAIPAPVKTLLYCLEGGENGLIPRLKRYPGITPELANNLTVEFSLSLASDKDFETLQKAIVASESALVIIDPLSCVAMPRRFDLNDRNSVSPMMNRLGLIAGETGACILILHHKKKGPKDDTANEEYDRSTATGSMALTDLASTRMHIRGLGHGERILYVFGKDVRLMELSVRHGKGAKEGEYPLWTRSRSYRRDEPDDTIDSRSIMGLLRCGICGVWSSEAVHDLHAIRPPRPFANERPR